MALYQEQKTTLDLCREVGVGSVALEAFSRWRERQPYAQTGSPGWEKAKGRAEGSFAISEVD